MRWLKFTAAGKTSWGIVEGEHVIAVNGDPFGEWQRGTQSHALKDVKVELPLIPRTFYCVGLELPQASQGSRRQGRHGAERARPARDRLPRPERADRP